MGSFAGKGSEAKQRLKKINKPMMPPNAHTPDAQLAFMLSELISRYIWDEKPESEILVKDLVSEVRIRRLLDFLMFFKNNMRYIRQSERLYAEMVLACQNEARWNDEDKKKAELVLIFLVNLYHIEKFRAIFVKSTRKWWLGKYFGWLQTELGLEMEVNEPIDQITEELWQQIRQRNIELKPQTEEKKVDFTKIKLVADFYLMGLYKDCYTYLSDVSSYYQDEATLKQNKYQIPQRQQL